MLGPILISSRIRFAVQNISVLLSDEKVPVINRIPDYRLGSLCAATFNQSRIVFLALPDFLGSQRYGAFVDHKMILLQNNIRRETFQVAIRRPSFVGYHDKGSQVRIARCDIIVQSQDIDDVDLRQGPRDYPN